MLRVGLLTSGGDCQALNATMRGIVKTLYRQSDEPVEVENLIGLFLFRGEFGGVYARGGYDGEIGPWSNRVTVGCLVARD